MKRPVLSASIAAALATFALQAADIAATSPAAITISVDAKAEGVRPCVELSFMPLKLARDPQLLFGFWYKPNISPPTDYARWDAMMQAFVRHLIDRYGIDEVAQWYFEVWNE